MMKQAALLALAILTVLCITRSANASQIRNIERQEIARVKATIAGLPGVRDEGHLDGIATGIVSAAAAATCSLDWSYADWCIRRWSPTRVELEAALITVGYWESRFLARIGQGQCRKDECDAYKDAQGRTHHRARGFYQVQRTGLITTREWRDIVGTGAWNYFTASSVAARVLASNRAWCKNPHGMFSGYARGGYCSWRGAGIRTAFFRRMLLKLQAPKVRVEAIAAAN